MPLTTPIAAQRVVQGATATLSAKFPDQDGEARVPAAVTVSVHRSDGSVVLAPALASVDGSGNPTVIVPSSGTAQLDILTLTWAEANGPTLVTLVEVVGARYFDLLEARSIDKVLQNTANYPDEDVKAARDVVEREVERITGRAFVPKFIIDRGNAAARTYDGTLPRLMLSMPEVRSVRWLNVDGVSYASSFWELSLAGELAFGQGLGLLPSQIANGPCGNDLPPQVSVGYEYGWDLPPEDLKRAMITRLRSRLLSGNTGNSSQATSQTVEGTTYTLAGKGKTGIPEVDQVYEDYTREDWKHGFVGSMRIS